jgi:hypothetical protein
LEKAAKSPLLSVKSKVTFPKSEVLGKPLYNAKNPTDTKTKNIKKKKKCQAVLRKGFEKKSEFLKKEP